MRRRRSTTNPESYRPRDYLALRCLYRPLKYKYEGKIREMREHSKTIDDQPVT